METLLGKTLLAMERVILTDDRYYSEPINLSDMEFLAAANIFMLAVLDRMWRLQEKEGLGIDDRAAMAQAVGNEIRKLIKVYTDTDTHTVLNEIR